MEHPKPTREQRELAKHWQLDLPRLLANPRQCLFTASGPTSKYAPKQRNWGTVVTLNRAIQVFKRVDYAFFGTPGKVWDTKAHHHKARHLVAVFAPDDVGAPKAIKNLSRRKQHLVLPIVPHHIRETKREYVDFILAGNVLGRASAAAIMLMRLGYSRFWLFGHDGGHERLTLAPSRRGYDKPQFCLKILLDGLGIPHSFFPDKPPVD